MDFIDKVIRWFRSNKHEHKLTYTIPVVDLVNIYLGILRDKRLIFNLEDRELRGPTYKIVGKDLIIDIIIKEEEPPKPPPPPEEPKPPSINPGQGSEPTDKPTQASI